MINIFSCRFIKTLWKHYIIWWMLNAVFLVFLFRILLCLLFMILTPHSLHITFDLIMKFSNISFLQSFNLSISTSSKADPFYLQDFTNFVNRSNDICLLKIIQLMFSITLIICHIWMYLSKYLMQHSLHLIECILLLFQMKFCIWYYSVILEKYV